MESEKEMEDLKKIQTTIQAIKPFVNMLFSNVVQRWEWFSSF
jgi:hypothetical protein